LKAPNCPCCALTWLIKMVEWHTNVPSLSVFSQQEPTALSRSSTSSTGSSKSSSQGKQQSRAAAAPPTAAVAAAAASASAAVAAAAAATTWAFFHVVCLLSGKGARVVQEGEDITVKMVGMVDVVEMKGMEDGGGVEPHQPDAATGLVMPMGASEDAGGSSRASSQ
jgi:biotin carboxyl carrier protein